jgi:predicted alpha-1,2-mannosidase
MMAGIYNYDDKSTWTFMRVENDTLITGYRQTNGWARTRTVYFAIVLSKPIQQYGFKDFSSQQVYKGFWRKFDQSKNFPEAAGKKIRMHLDFQTTENEKVKMKVALSPVSTLNAIQNLQKETPHWDFNRTKEEGQKTWNNELKKISIDALSRNDMINFYTAYYHALLGPTVYMDADGSYRGIDQSNHRANGFTNYTTFSLWDTYRALHPFFNLIQPKRNADMVMSMLAHYDQSVHHMLPVWSHHANENWCMIGYHSVSVIADAIIKGSLTSNADRALDACIATANQKYYDGLEYYISKGYVPEDKNSSSVSKTLEYAYDDWCIAQLAKKLNRMDVYDRFLKRSENWKNVYDRSIGFMRPRLNDGSFKKNFDVLSTHGQGFIEGNAWNYSLYVPHAPRQMIDLMGGKQKFTAHLDSLFTMDLPDKFFADTEDITRDGIIGNYVHGNEPAHHVAYLYNWTDQPWKSQQRVRMILNHQYKAKPDGLGGNDDCGQMSAWYIFSSLGFYPVAPGSDQYAIGSPSIKNASLQLENGKTFTIECKNQSDKNVYVQKIMLNGNPLKNLFISHTDVMNGGTLQFQMGASPAKKEFQ